MSSTSLTRSASLGDLLEEANNNANKEDKLESLQEPPALQQAPHWKWLQNSKSFHDRFPSPGNGKVLFASASGDPDRSITNHSSRGFVSTTTPTRTSSTPTRSTQPPVAHAAAHPRYLEHLETLLPQYCHHLSHPTYQEAAHAMSLLLNSTPPLPPGERVVDMDPPMSPKQSRDKNKKDSKSSVKSEMNRILSSPFRKRRTRTNSAATEAEATTKKKSLGGRRWSTMSSHSIEHSDHNNLKPTASKIDQTSWHDFVAPLILLAGSEAIYADLEHVHPNPSMIQWPGLYQRVASELRGLLPQEENPSHSPPRATEEAFKRPKVTDPPSPPQVQNSARLLFPNVVLAKGILPPPQKTAATPPQYKRLRSLCTWLDVKLQWLPFHESLYLKWNCPNNLGFLRKFAAGALPSPTDCNGRLLEALKQEIQATLALIELGHCLERARFLETICLAKRVKQHLMALSFKETALVLWMRTTFQDYLSIMAVVFDKIHTFATPLYGFDQQILMEATQGERTMLSDKKGVMDLDSLVIEFLRRQERAGGTAMAVSIVLDTEGSENDDPATAIKPRGEGARHFRRVELGFAIHDDTKQSVRSNLSNGTPVRSNLSNATAGSQQRQQVAGGTANAPSEGEEKIVEPRQWPAIYLRSSMRLGTQVRGSTTGSAGAGLGLISGMRRSANSRGSGFMDGPSSSHGSGILLSQGRNSTDGMSPRSKYHRKSGSSSRNLLAHGNIFEYETEPSLRPSWPHSEWLLLRAFLETMNQGPGTNVVTDHLPSSPTASPRKSGDVLLPSGSPFEEPLAVTLQPDGVETEEPREPASAAAVADNHTSSVRSVGSLWDPLPRTNSLSQSTSEQRSTTFHAVHLSNYMWMVVMVKGEEESRWHRRKSRGLADNEIRAFLNDMASKLRVSNRFLGLKTCQTARVKVKDPLAPRVRGRDLGLREAQWQTGNPEDDDNLQDEVLELMKEAFSVTGTTAIMNRAESILTTMSGGLRPSAAGSRSPRDRRRVLAMKKRSGPFAQNSDYREGAALLFLGPELYRQFLESTNE